MPTHQGRAQADLYKILSAEAGMMDPAVRFFALELQTIGQVRMSSIEQAIKEAVDQGYQPNVERYPEMEWISPLQIAMAMQADVFIDPAFWKALGKKRGWTTDDDFKYWQKSVVEWEEKYWKKFWHRFIDHLAEGKDAESFFQSLDSKSRERPDSHH